LLFDPCIVVIGDCITITKAGHKSTVGAAGAAEFDAGFERSGSVLAMVSVAGLLLLGAPVLDGDSVGTVSQPAMTALHTSSSK